MSMGFIPAKSKFIVFRDSVAIRMIQNQFPLKFFYLNNFS